MKMILLALACALAVAGCDPAAGGIPASKSSSEIKEITASADGNYLMVPDSWARIYKFYDGAGFLCFVVDKGANGVAISCVPTEAEPEIIPIPDSTNAA